MRRPPNTFTMISHTGVDSSARRANDARKLSASSRCSAAAIFSLIASRCRRSFSRSVTCLFYIAALLVGSASIAADNSPPFGGTVWQLPTTLITDADPTRIREVSYRGLLQRTFYIFRDGGFRTITEDVHVFDAGHIEVQVHPELGDREAAREQAEIYAPIFGRLPWAVVAGVQELEIQRQGLRASLPLPQVVTVHTEATVENPPDVIRHGFMEEMFLHEAVHVTLDPHHKAAPGWLDAQRADPTFISTYAQDWPNREDLAETLSAWFAVRYRPDRLSASQEQAILDAVPARLAYLDRQHFDMSPYVRVAPVPALPLAGLLLLAVLLVTRGVRMR